MASTMSAEEQQKVHDLQELVYRYQPQERLVTAIHRMAVRYSVSMDAGRYQRGGWQLNAIDRLSRALYRFGRE